MINAIMKISQQVQQINNILLRRTSMNRQNWTVDEDRQLRQVVQKNGSEDWTKNAQLLHQISMTAYQKKRTGKQCRQRWYNHLDPNVLKSEWKPQQQTELFLMHKIHGNKWKQLSKYLPGRTDNDIKNHFYSTLRRSLRRLNKYIGQKNSTNQMRQIKPSVLTYIVNYIYKHQAANKYNKALLNSLKQLPQLIFKFSNFKPVKKNMDKKVDENLKQKILIILNLVDQFKQIDTKVKQNQSLSTKQIKRKQKQSNIKIQNKTTNASIRQQVPYLHMSQDQQIEESVQVDQGHQVSFSQLDHLKQQDNSRNDRQDFQNNLYEFHQRTIQRQFSPIVTIQRKLSSLDQKGTSKKLILIQRTQQKLEETFKNQQDQTHAKIASFQPFNQLKFQQQRMNNQFLSIQQPSMELNQNSNIFSDLIVVGKHIQPIQYLPTNNEHHNDNDIDQVLYQNYQQ